MIIIELLSLQRARRKGSFIFAQSSGAAGTHMTSSVALGLNFIKGQCGLSTSHVLPGAGGGGCERVGETILQIQSMAGLPGGLFCI